MQRIVYVADLHVGSDWGLCNPEDTPRYSPGKETQRRLYDFWATSVSGKWAKPDALYVLGDANEGQNRKGSGTDLWTSNILQQVDAASDLLKMWQAREIYMVGGSKYHVEAGDSGLSAEELIARKVNAVEYPNQEHIPRENRMRSGAHWFLTTEQVTAHLAHHISVSKVFAYMSTPIAREMMTARLNDPMRRTWENIYRDKPALISSEDFLRESAIFKTRMIVRAHAHYFWVCDTGGSLGMILPCWKAQDRFLSTRNPLGFYHIGFVGVIIDGDSVEYEAVTIRSESVQRPPHTVTGAVHLPRGDSDAAA